MYVLTPDDIISMIDNLLSISNTKYVGGLSCMSLSVSIPAFRLRSVHQPTLQQHHLARPKAFGIMAKQVAKVTQTLPCLAPLRTAALDLVHLIRHDEQLTCLSVCLNQFYS